PRGGGQATTIRTELRITAVVKGKPRAQTIWIDHTAIPRLAEYFSPGETVLALLNPRGPADGRPDSLVYLSADPIHTFWRLSPDQKLPPELAKVLSEKK